MKTTTQPVKSSLNYCVLIIVKLFDFLKHFYLLFHLRFRDDLTKNVLWIIKLARRFACLVRSISSTTLHQQNSQQVALKSSLVLNLNLFEWFHGQLCWRFAFKGLTYYPSNSVRVYVSKFRILRAHGLLTSSENWLLFSITSIPTALQMSARICP